jgi:hypothetical protein
VSLKEHNFCHEWKVPRQGVKGQSQMTDIKHVRLIEYLRVGMFMEVIFT